MNLKEVQKQFLINECWMLSIQAAFQRANVYVSKKEDKRKGAMRDSLKVLIVDEMMSSYRKGKVSETDHLGNIQHICDRTTAGYAEILRGNEMRYGIAQKLLNLYLKYLWCLGEIPPPPHFPLDSRIQNSMKLEQGANWTDMKEEAQYLPIITEAKNKYLPEYGSLSEMELVLFGRASAKNKKPKKT